MYARQYHLLFQTRCTQGQLALYTTHVAIELKSGLLGTIRSDSLAYSQITGVNVLVKVFTLFGLGGGSTIKIYSEGTQELIAHLVKPKDAEKVKEIILSKITR